MMRGSRRNVAAVAAVATLLGGALLANALRSDSPPNEAGLVAASGEVRETASATAVDDGDPTILDVEIPPEAATQPLPELNNVFPQTEMGARGAAISYLEGTEEAVQLSPEDAALAQRLIATGGYADEFEADTERRMLDLTAAIPNGIVLRVAPIEARSTQDDGDWLVSIWYVQAITIADETVVDDWRTVHYRMRWEGGTWKVADFRSERGPMPGRGTQPPSAPAGQFEAQLAGFTDEGL